jgi:hypothetical protein
VNELTASARGLFSGQPLLQILVNQATRKLQETMPELQGNNRGIVADVGAQRGCALREKTALAGN